MKWYQQGDVMIKPVKKIPEDAQNLPHNVLARGEATGHTHEAFGKQIWLYRDDSNLYMNAPHGAEVRHQEHAPVSVPPGTYLIQIVREYDHFSEQAREVWD